MRYIILFLFSTSLWAITYDLKDLEVLVTQKDYFEFFKHVKDIRPSLRDKKWHKTLSMMGEEFLSSLIKQENFSATAVDLVEHLISWPTLKKNHLFHQRYDHYMLMAMQNSKQYNKEILWGFWLSSTQEAQTAKRLLSLYQIKQLEVPLAILQKVSNGPVATFNCREQIVQNVVFNRLYKNYLANPKELSIEQVRVLNIDCLKSMTRFLKDKLFSSNTSKADMAFLILYRNKLLGQEEQNYFLFNYFMQRPKEGDILNFAWSMLDQLRKNYSARLKLLNRIKQSPFLPDHIFKLGSTSKRLAFLTHLSRSFPEYIDLYLKQCIAFFTGKREFPFGNPTLNCRSFVQNRYNLRFIPLAYLNHLRRLNLVKK